jgi:type IX secretion system PorP/SprF family membrane protein
MMKITKLLLGCFLYTAVAGQDVHFSQFYNMPLLRNPGLSGIFNAQYQASALYRNQWGSISAAFQTMALGAEVKVIGPSLTDPFSLTLGLQVVRDQVGAANFTRTAYMPNISGRLSLANGMYISAGFLAGPVTSTLNVNNLTWSDEYVNGIFTGITNQPFGFTQKNYFDLGAGVVLGSSDPDATQWYAGIASYHLNKPSVGVGQNNDLPVRLSINGGLGLKLAEDERLFFYGDGILQGTQYEYLFGGMYTKYFVDDNDENEEGISFGAFYRWNDAIVPTVRLSYDKWVVGFSYDFNVSQLAAGSKVWGGPELTVKFKGFASAAKALNCPRGTL